MMYFQLDYHCDTYHGHLYTRTWKPNHAKNLEADLENLEYLKNDLENSTFFIARICACPSLTPIIFSVHVLWSNLGHSFRSQVTFDEIRPKDTNLVLVPFNRPFQHKKKVLLGRSHILCSFRDMDHFIIIN